MARTKLPPMTQMLEQAILLATQAHRGHLDRAGQPFITHPLRVMNRVRTEAEKIVAVLHDVLEDTPTTADELRRAGFSEAVVEAVEALTKREGQPYDELIDRAMANPLARPVKIADLEDNMDIRRSATLVPADLERLNKYLRAWRKLTQV